MDAVVIDRLHRILERGLVSDFVHFDTGSNNFLFGLFCTFCPGSALNLDRLIGCFLKDFLFVIRQTVIQRLVDAQAFRKYQVLGYGIVFRRFEMARAVIIRIVIFLTVDLP